MFRLSEDSHSVRSTMQRIRRLFGQGAPFLGALGLVLTFAQAAAACPDHQYEQCTIFGCVCLPKVDVPNIVSEPPIQSGGHALAAWLTQSRNNAINGAQPIPFQIRQLLAGQVEEDLLNRARFKIGDPGVFNLANLSISYGNASAVTLVDVIVFKNGNDAYNNPALWVHELTHIKQFRDWGTTDFAISYVRNSNGIENPAYEAQNNYRRPTVYNPPPPPPPPTPMGRMVVCVTFAGTSNPFFGQPNLPCYMMTPSGPIHGIAR
jgi:hypothetical protein